MQHFTGRHMEKIIAVEIVPVVDDNYYKLILYDFLDADDTGPRTKVVREIFHVDNLGMAIDLLNQLSDQGEL